MARSLPDIGKHETIAAIITPPGEGGIAAIRLAGRRGLAFFRKHFAPARGASAEAKPFVMRYGHFIDATGAVIDEVTAVYMPQGKSYTGLEQVEIFCHGGRHVAVAILNELLAAGARVAEPGEFTKLAFLSGRIDLAKAEAVAEIISANTSTSYRAAREHLLGPYSERIKHLREQVIEIIADVEASIDFPEEEIEPAEADRLVKSVDRLISDIGELATTYRGGRIVREGFTVAIAGRPNAGKSSLFNLLLRQERALVTPAAGTTRDYLAEWIDLDGFAVELIDTAGLRPGGGLIERAGQQWSRRMLGRADLVLWMVDLSGRSWERQLLADLRWLDREQTLLLGNKIDLVNNYKEMLSGSRFRDMAPISCRTKKGLKQLTKALVGRINDSMPDTTSGLMVTSARHQQKLKRALKHLRAGKRIMSRCDSPEITAFELRQACAALDEIIGKIYTEEILGKIFSKFCVGK